MLLVLPKSLNRGVWLHDLLEAGSLPHRIVDIGQFFSAIPLFSMTRLRTIRLGSYLVDLIVVILDFILFSLRSRVLSLLIVEAF